jgi:hypothetical protein
VTPWKTLPLRGGHRGSEQSWLWTRQILPPLNSKIFANWARISPPAGSEATGTASVMKQAKVETRF